MEFGKGLVVSAVILVFLLAVFFAGKPSITGYAVADDVNMEVDNAALRFGQLNSGHKEFLDVFGINLDSAKLDEFRGRLGLIAPGDEASESQMQAELASFLEVLPKQITSSSFRDSQAVDLNDMGYLDAADSEDAYRHQNKIKVIFEITKYDVEFYSGAKATYTIMRKMISASEPLADASLREIVPFDASLVSFYTPGYALLDSAAGITRVEYKYSSLTNTEIVYGIKQDSSNAYDFKTLLAPAAGEIIETTSLCGDGNCVAPFEDEITCLEDCKVSRKNIPWLYIIILAVILALGIFYLNFYRGRFDFRRLFKGKNPFASEADLSTVKMFIMDSIKKGISLPEITKALLNKGWNKNQVEYAFEDARWELRKVLLEVVPKANTSDISSAEAYIKKCVAVGMDELKIKTALFSKGWKPEQIDLALKNARKGKI